MRTADSVRYHYKKKHLRVFVQYKADIIIFASKEHNITDIQKGYTFFREGRLKQRQVDVY